MRWWPQPRRIGVVLVGMYSGRVTPMSLVRFRTMKDAVKWCVKQNASDRGPVNNMTLFMPDDDDATPAMQVRCVHCLREQYALNVIGVSSGEDGCSWCGKTSRPMTRQEYREALLNRRIEMRGFGDE